MPNNGVIVSIMKRLQVLAINLLVILSLGFSQQAAAVEQKEPVIIDNAVIQRTILKDVNTYRVKRGLPPLKMMEIISFEAEKHSRDMASQAIPFGHQYFNERISRLFKQIDQCQGGAENVAYAYPFKEMVKNWLTSRGHRRNIEGNYNLTGIGIARDKKGKIYYTQIFLRRL